MLIKDHWYIACPASRLKEREPREAQFGDLRVVLFRGKNGEPHALLDRCCHRGVKLSRGRVHGNGCIACRYHGWEYNSKGEVQHIPSLGTESSLPNYKVPSFHTRESHYYVWVWIPGENETPTYEPELKGIGPGTWIQSSSVWNCNIIPAVENQLDSAHPAFSHPSTYPTFTSDRGEMPVLKRVKWKVHVEGGNRVEMYILPNGLPLERPSLDDPKSSLVVFEMPYRNYVFIPTANVRSISSWVPLSENSVRLEFMSLSWPPREPGQISVKLWEEELELLAEDRVLVESAQDTFNPSGDKHVRADRPPLAARQIINHAHQAAETPPEDQEYEFEVYA